MIAEHLLEYVLDWRFLVQLCVGITIYYAIKVLMFFDLRRRRYKLFKYYGIPGPEPSLLDGNHHLYRRTPRMFETDLELKAKYGPIYGIYYGDAPLIVITDVDILRKIFLESHPAFSLRADNKLDIPTTHGLLFTNRKRWKAMRKILSAPFQRLGRRGSAATEFLEDTIRLMIDYIEQKFLILKRDKVLVDISSLVKATSLYIVSDMAVNLPNVEIREHEPHVESLDSYMATADNKTITLALMFPIAMDALNWLMKGDMLEQNTIMHHVRTGINKSIDATLRKISQGYHYQHHQQNNNNNNNNNSAATDLGERKIIHVMAEMLHEKQMSRIEVLGNAETILFAGYDTTSMTLAYLFWALGKYQDIQTKLRAELMAHGVDSAYLSQVINETMRLYPIVVSFTTRLATQTATVNGLTVPEGTQVIYNNWLMFRDPKLWQNADTFDPDRFRDANQIDPVAFAPFGLGERKCLGMQLAQLEMRIIVCDLLLRYHVKLVSPSDLVVVSCAGSLTKPAEPIIIELERVNKKSL